jgi:hypothetical protein
LLGGHRDCQETVNKQQKTITEQAHTLSKQAAIITTLQATAKDHTLALKGHSTEVNALYNKIIELCTLCNVFCMKRISQLLGIFHLLPSQ